MTDSAMSINYTGEIQHAYVYTAKGDRLTHFQIKHTICDTASYQIFKSQQQRYFVKIVTNWCNVVLSQYHNTDMVDYVVWKTEFIM